jgi:hypothetical protein
LCIMNYALITRSQLCIMHCAFCILH